MSAQSVTSAICGCILGGALFIGCSTGSEPPSESELELSRYDAPPSPSFDTADNGTLRPRLDDSSLQISFRILYKLDSLEDTSAWSDWSGAADSSAFQLPSRLNAFQRSDISIEYRQRYAGNDSISPAIQVPYQESDSVHLALVPSFLLTSDTLIDSVLLLGFSGLETLPLAITCSFPNNENGILVLQADPEHVGNQVCSGFPLAPDSIVATFQPSGSEISWQERYWLILPDALSTASVAEDACLTPIRIQAHLALQDTALVDTIFCSLFWSGDSLELKVPLRIATGVEP